MKYILAMEGENFIIINKLENRRVIWLSKDHCDLEFAEKILKNFNKEEI